MNRRERSKNSIFKIMFASYCAMLILPLLALLLTYGSSSAIIKEEIQTYNQYLLDECMRSSEEVFDLTDHTMNSMAFSHTTQEFLVPYTYKGSSLLTRAKAAYQSLSVYEEVYSSSGILDMLIYAGNSDCLVSRKAPYSRLEHYDGVLLFPDRDLKFSDFLAQHIGAEYICPATEVEIYDRSYNAILFFKPILAGYRSNPSDSVVAVVDTSEFAEKLMKMNLGSTGIACIADDDGRILLQVCGGDTQPAASLQELDFPEKDYLRFDSQSPASGRRCVAYIPKGEIYFRLRSLRTVIAVILVVDLVLGLILSWRFSYKNSEPILDLFRLLDGRSGEDKDVSKDYNFLKGTISKMVSSYGELSEKLERQTLVIRSDFLLQLLRGTISRNQTESLSEYLSFNLAGQSYSVLLVNNTGYGEWLDSQSMHELESASVLILSTFSQTEAFRAYGAQYNQQVSAFLLIFQERDASACRRKLEETIARVHRLLGERLHFPLSYLCGGFCEDLDELSELFDRAVSLLDDESVVKSGSVTFYDASQARRTHTAVFPIETESRLINLVATGQTRLISALISDIYKGKKGPLQDSELQLMNQQMYLTMLRISESLHDDALAQESKFLLGHHSGGRAEDISEKVIERLTAACQRASSEKADEESRLKQSILDYVEENLSDSGFTLYDVALHFDYAESYLYRVFREQFGCTFSVMLETLRLERACQALERGDSIEATAQICGYNSSHTFRRAFKKRKGMLPSDYRDSFEGNGRPLI